jgi:hypothetical protein
MLVWSHLPLSVIKLKFSGLDQVKEEKKNFSGLIFLYMKATIPGTHGSLVTSASVGD